MFGKKNLKLEANSTAASNFRQDHDVAISKKGAKAPFENESKESDHLGERPLDDQYNETKRQIFSILINSVDASKILSMTSEEGRGEISQVLSEIIRNQQIRISKEEESRLLEDITNDMLGFGPLEQLLSRDDIADIMVNGYKNVYVEVNGHVRKTGIQFRDDEQLMNVCQRIVSIVGRRVDEASPICDARLLDGSRVNVIVPPLSVDGPTLTIRKFKKDKLRLSDLIGFGSITPEAGQLLEIIGHVRCNVLISGGTGSGKTTLLNCLTAYIDPTERIVTCEDTAELQLQQPHVVRLETRPRNVEGQGEITMRDLVKNCLRMRPERIIVGEVRGAEAFDLLQAMNTGHDGSMGTLHANSPREALARLESMVIMGSVSLPSKVIKEMIASSIDVIIQASRLRDGSRKIIKITEVLGMEGDVITTQDLLTYEVEGEGVDGKLIGQHYGNRISKPGMWERAKYFGDGPRLERVMSKLPEKESVL